MTLTVVAISIDAASNFASSRLADPCLVPTSVICGELTLVTRESVLDPGGTLAKTPDSGTVYDGLLGLLESRIVARALSVSSKELV